MHKRFFTIFSLLVVLALLLAPLGAGQKAAAQTLPPERLPKELPAEVRDAFKNGMTVDQFLALNKGPIPAALWSLVDKPIAVIIELDQPSLIASMLAQGQDPRSMSKLLQSGTVNRLAQAQAPLVAE
ncbi:MAG TPA: hypothetical protein PJ988_12945, partial [Anaerolinea sp.]|nr:hypothetical protein [Anaerolinea sp.]